MMGAGTRKEPIISRTYADTKEVGATYMPRLYEVTIPQLPATSTIQVHYPTRLISTAPSSPEENLPNQTLEDTLNMRRFRELVLAESPEAIEDGPRDPEESTHTMKEVTTAEVIPTLFNATRSGRVPKAVMGTRLIDQI